MFNFTLGEDFGQENLEDKQEPVSEIARHQNLVLSNRDNKIPGIGDSEYPAHKAVEDKANEKPEFTSSEKETNKELSSENSIIKVLFQTLSNT